MRLKVDKDVLNAISYSDLDGVKKLISDMDIYENRREYREFILDSFRKQKVDIFNYLISIINIDEFHYINDKPLLFYIINEDSFFIAEIYDHQFDMILHMMDQMTDINKTDYEGDTILNHIIWEYKDYNLSDGKLRDIIIELLKRGLNPNIPDDSNHTAFSLAVNNIDFELLKLLVENSKYRVGIEPVIEAILEENYDIIEYLIPRLNDINGRDIDDHTALWHAKNPDTGINTDIVELLEMSGARD